MPRNPTAVQTPGETPTAPAADQPAADAFQAVGIELSGDDPEPAGAGDNSEVAELRALVQRQNEQMSAMMAAVTQLQANQVRQAPSAKVSQEAALPDISEVDLKAINEGNTPVLTKQGWVVPVNFGTDPAQLQKLKDEALQRQAMTTLVNKLSSES